jgi:hypothetical protein
MLTSHCGHRSVHLQVRVALGQEDSRQHSVNIDAAIALLPAALSPWQLSDMLRVASLVSALQCRARYAHLRPSGMDVLLGRSTPSSASKDSMASSTLSSEENIWQLPARPHSPSTVPYATWSQVWRYATLAIRAELRSKACIGAARRSRSRRFLHRYWGYLGACSMLYGARILHQNENRWSQELRSCAAEAAVWAAAAEGGDSTFFEWLGVQCNHAVNVAAEPETVGGGCTESGASSDAGSHSESALEGAKELAAVVGRGAAWYMGLPNGRQSKQPMHVCVTFWQRTGAFPADRRTADQASFDGTGGGGRVKLERSLDLRPESVGGGPGRQPEAADDMESDSARGTVIEVPITELAQVWQPCASVCLCCKVLPPLWC